MPSHKVSLTNRGFKILSTDISVDSLSLLFLAIMIFLNLFIQPNLLIVFIPMMILSGAYYFFHRFKVGYLYPIGFLYQLFLFFIITPNFGLNILSLLVSLSVLFLLLYFENPFRTLYFPIGLFLSLIATSVSLVFRYYNDTFLQINSKLIRFEDTTISGQFFKTTFLENGFPAETFSFYELGGLFSILLIAPIFLRQFSLTLDSLLYFGFLMISAFYYRFDMEIFGGKVFTLATLFYLILSAPGRNFGFSYLFAGLTVFLSSIIIYWFVLEVYVLPPILVIVIYFFVQSIFFKIVSEVEVKRLPLLGKILER
ncbi:MAG: hypothetical protein SFU98_18780 [Leptospiraceae bacterium]|nr:hypothetical protein [Leptospiraceae bacterium]